MDFQLHIVSTFVDNCLKSNQGNPHSSGNKKKVNQGHRPKVENRNKQNIEMNEPN